MSLHRKYYLSSVVNTLLFYGTCIAVCLLLNVFVVLFITVFFSRFYRKEISAAIRHPFRTLLGHKPFEHARYSVKVLPAGDLAGTENNSR